ncbi:MAG: hypothetical protein HUJ78_00070 [Mogibacterium sp.]|nr:hypothetical protein [Mogibacterium sp.]
MSRRVDLHHKLENIMAEALGIEPEDTHVYFQPPESLKMKYPCIVYSRDREVELNADNMAYQYYRGYQVMVISLDPDSPILDLFDLLPLCSFSRHYVVDSLHHDVYVLYH